MTAPEPTTTTENERKAQQVRDRLAHEHLTYLAWCAQRGLDPEEHHGEGHWAEFWDDGGAVDPTAQDGTR